jgi:PD-(D/E)XK endonuclease
MKIDKNNTGLASEYFVAAELYRRGFSVGMTIGNAKAIDLLAEKDGRTYQIQVKGIQSTKSICWNLKRDGIKKSSDFYYVLVNLNVDDFGEPEFFILTGMEAFQETKPTNSGRDYIDIGPLKKKGSIYAGNWNKLEIFENQVINNAPQMPIVLNLERHLEKIMVDNHELLLKLA